MAARSDFLIGAQIGAESSYGTGVTAGKKFPLLELDISPEMMQRQYRGAGFKYPNGRVKHREWATGTYRMPLGFAELVYPLSSLFGAPTPAQIGVTGGYTWAFTTNKTAADTPKSFTAQVGDASAAQEVNGLLFNSLDITISQDEATASGAVIGQTWDDAATLDTVSSTLEQVPVSINQFDVFIDTTYGGLGTTKWAKPYEFSLRIPEKYQPQTVLNSTYPSFVEPVEVPLEDITGTLVVMDDAQARSLSSAMRASTLPVYFLQMKAVGANIGALADYLLKINLGVKLTNTRARRGVQSTYAREFDFALFADTSMASPIEATLVNKLTAL
jgi:hypothetical protein